MASPATDLAAFCADLATCLEAEDIQDKAHVHRLKLALTRKHRLDAVPSDATVLRTLAPHVAARFRPILRSKATRTASGVAVVAAMTAPHPCPHGTCVYCPGGPRVGTPQSYTGREGAALRAAKHGYDPFRQTRARLAQLRAIGHPTDKVDFIVLGGTFTALDPDDQRRFIQGCFDGLNGFASDDLEAAHRANETAASRCVGLTIETKPDCFLGKDVDRCLGLGVTRVELGLQSTHDDVLRRANRGHTAAEGKEAIRRGKDAGLKVGLHMMPGLPGSDVDRDLASFRALFDDPAWRPDMLKIYPTLVLPDTGLYRMWRRGAYRPLTTEETVELLAKVKALVPPWVRIQRIQREIEAPLIAAGNRRGDVRVLAQERLAREGRSCRCIRCREIGLRRAPLDPDAVHLHRVDYEASGGTEVFLSYEDADRSLLVGYARLRSGPSGAFLRELKVFGDLVPLRERPEGRWQHRGFGTRLMGEAERVAREDFDHRRLRVTSGVGVRNYYRRLGYVRDGPYMAKAL
jgi:elongator complex protein 3